MRRRLTATLAMSSPPRTHTWRMAGSVAVASALLLRMLATSPRNGGRRDLRSLSYLGELDRRLHFERSPSLIEEFLRGLEELLDEARRTLEVQSAIEFPQIRKTA